MKWLLFILFFLPVCAKAQIITTIAGNGTLGSTGDGGPATAASISPWDCAVDRQGNVYIAEGSRIRKIDLSGIITTIAGTGVPGFSGDGGPATAAQLNTWNIVLDDTGNIFISHLDSLSVRIRKINAATKVITTIAGIGGCLPYYYHSWVEGAKADTSCIYLSDFCLDKYGNIYYIGRSFYGSKVVKIDTSGILTTFVSDTALLGGDSHAITIDTAGNVYVDYYYSITGGPIFGGGYVHSSILRVNNGMLYNFAGSGRKGYSGDGGPATKAKVDVSYSSFAMDRGRNFYFSTYTWDGATVRMVDPASIICTVAGNGKAGSSGDGGPAIAASFDGIAGIAVDTAGNLYIAEKTRIRKVTQPVCGYLAMADVSEVTQPTISIHPNPAQNMLTISSPVVIIEIAIADLVGKVLFASEYNKDEVQIDVSALPPGIYLLRVNGTEVRKFVKE
jgi:hypothetical protein